MEAVLATIDISRWAICKKTRVAVELDLDLDLDLDLVRYH